MGIVISDRISAFLAGNDWNLKFKMTEIWNSEFVNSIKQIGMHEISCLGDLQEFQMVVSFALGPVLFLEFLTRIQTVGNFWGIVRHCSGHLKFFVFFSCSFQILLMWNYIFGRQNSLNFSSGFWIPPGHSGFIISLRKTVFKFINSSNRKFRNL